MGLIKLETLKKNERFWYTSVKFKKLSDSHDPGTLAYCQIDKENGFVYIKKDALVQREF